MSNLPPLRIAFDAWLEANGNASALSFSLREMLFLSWKSGAEEAVKQEREACAKMCEDMPAGPSIHLLCKAFADAIRARNQ